MDKNRTNRAAAGQRAQALLAYFWAVANDPRVKAGRTGDEIFDAVVACMRADWVDVWATILESGGRVIRERAPAAVGAIAEEFVGRALDWLRSSPKR